MIQPPEGDGNLRPPLVLDCRPGGGSHGRWIAALAGAIAFGLTVAANGSPQAPTAQPKMAGVPVNFMGFRDRGGTNYVLQAPKDYAWVRVFGNKGSPVTRSAALTCPTRRAVTGATYGYTCTFVLTDYAPGRYNVGGPRVTRRANAVVGLILDPQHSTLQIDLGTTTVIDETTKPPRTTTEPARSATLQQVRL